MKPTLIIGSLVILLPTVATADTNAPDPILEPIVGRTITGAHDGIILARHIVEGPTTPGTGYGLEPGDNPDPALMLSRVIYLNKNGATLTPGATDNSSTNRSTIVDTTRNFPAWTVSATTWNQVVSALQDMYAPFGVTVTDVAPAAGVRHIEAIFGGTAGDALPADQVPPPSEGVILGVSPFTIDCNVIEDSIVFTFAESAEQVGQSPRQIAEIAAQEIAHSVGLDHALNASDPMTYLDYTGNRSFKAGTVSCGEYSARECGLVQYGYPACRANQDSVGLLLERLGPPTGGNPGDTLPPDLSITAPQNFAVVPPDFTVYVSATDNTAVTSVDLYVDDILMDSANTTPFQLHAEGISLGDHQVRVVASDGVQESTREIGVTVEDGADPVDPGDGGNPDDGGDDQVTGGCSAGHGGGAGLVLGLALVGLIRRRRR